MLRPIELQLFPSCYNCVSWSADGEIAVAAGEYVQILTPKHTTEQGGNGSASDATSKNWNVTRFRVNVFTNKEWTTIWPQKRANFSIGPEQSLSTVVGLAWSPPGLAKYRRCILAVLTSNLLLSFYDISPQGRWTRVAIVNDCLNPYFNPLVQDEELRRRKFNIRAFTWCPPLKVPSAEEHATGYAVLGPESRWGLQFLTVTNDDNDVMILEARRSKLEPTSSLYAFDVLSLISINDPSGNYQDVQPGSIFFSALKQCIKATAMSFGPWIHQSTKDSMGVCSAIGNVAIVLGIKIKTVRYAITLMPPDEQTGAEVVYKTLCDSEENTALHGGRLDKYNFTGPLSWLSKDESSEIALAAGSFAGMVVLRSSSAAYQGEETAAAQIQVQELPFYVNTGSEIGNDTARHWPQTSAMTVALDEESGAPILHIGTVGGFTATMTRPSIQDSDRLPPSPWKKQMDSIREQFDIARDLGGFTIARIWGLASYSGLVVAAITVHPGDTIEYRTSAEERVTLVFSYANPQLAESEDLVFPQLMPDRSPDALRKRREAILGYILFIEDGDYSKLPLSRKLLYAAACCTIVDSQDAKLLFQAREALEWLASVSDANLVNEISKCSAPGSTIDAKPAEQLQGPGQQIFEQCSICDAGITWYSAAEAQCATGHLFVRCEYLSEDLVHDELQHTCRILSDAFDTCIYCSGKLQA
ncbi:hypothetical protein BBP40_005634 [Aspergillus hancockii]|nr:hypothetical protein BBP40_005634 [Aspergillus hancockii]